MANLKEMLQAQRQALTMDKSILEMATKGIYAPVHYWEGTNEAGDQFSLDRHHHHEPGYCVSFLFAGGRKPREFWFEKMEEASDFYHLLQFVKKPSKQPKD